MQSGQSLLNHLNPEFMSQFLELVRKHQTSTQPQVQQQAQAQQLQTQEQPYLLNNINFLLSEVNKLKQMFSQEVNTRDFILQLHEKLAEDLKNLSTQQAISREKNKEAYDKTATFAKNTNTSIENIWIKINGLSNLLTTVQNASSNTNNEAALQAKIAVLEGNINQLIENQARGQSIINDLTSTVATLKAQQQAMQSQLNSLLNNNAPIQTPAAQLFVSSSSTSNTSSDDATDTDSSVEAPTSTRRVAPPKVSKAPATTSTVTTHSLWIKASKAVEEANEHLLDKIKNHQPLSKAEQNRMDQANALKEVFMKNTSLNSVDFDRRCDLETLLSCVDVYGSVINRKRKNLSKMLQAQQSTTPTPR